MPTKKSSVKTPSKEEYDDLALECEQRKNQVEQAQEVAEQAQAAMAQLELERAQLERELATMRAFYEQQGQQGQQPGQGQQQQGNEQQGLQQGVHQGVQQQGQQGLQGQYGQQGNGTGNRLEGNYGATPQQATGRQLDYIFTAQQDDGDTTGTVHMDQRSGDPEAASDGTMADVPTADTINTIEQLKAEVSGSVSAGAELIPSGQMKSIRETCKEKNVPLSVVVNAATREISNYLGVGITLAEMLELGADNIPVCLMIRKMAEELRANKLTVEESKLLVQMRNAQRASGRVFQSGLPPIGGWPGNLWQLPHTDANGTTRWDYATDTPNFLEFARKINGIFQTLENTLTGLPCGARVNAAMGPNTDAFIMRPGVNVAVIGRLVRLVLGSVDTNVTKDGFLQSLSAFYVHREYMPTKQPSVNVDKLATGMTELSMQARALLELQRIDVVKDENRALIYRNDVVLWFDTARDEVLDTESKFALQGRHRTLVARVLELTVKQVRKVFPAKMDVHEAAAQLNALVQSVRNEESTVIASHNRMVGTERILGSIGEFFNKNNQRNKTTGNDGSGGGGGGNPRRHGADGGRGTGAAREGNPRKGGKEGGGGSEMEERKATAAECTIFITSSRPITGNLYETKEVFALAGQEGKLFQPGDDTGFIRTHPEDPTKLSIKFRSPEIARKAQAFYDGCVIEGVKMSATMAIGSARANRVKVQPGNAWARRSIFSPASSDGDDASTTSSLSDAMSTASGYSDQIEEATARRATGSATEGTSGGASGGGHTMGGASLSSPGIVLSDDQTAELREVRQRPSGNQPRQERIRRSCAKPGRGTGPR